MRPVAPVTPRTAEPPEGTRVGVGVPRRRGQRGSVAAVLLGVLALVVVVTLGLGRLGAAATARARADAVADVTALAAAGAGEDVAGRVARRSGASAVQVRRLEDGVHVVRIEVEGVHARAAATASW